ncbi:MAG: phthalate 4,5-dioxygenase [Rhodospirillales bacterium]|jgi:phenylpropionate dioxygenase-like ring-hydroxylating dioxygenase large terminal subunit|nr:phthalate 4,5-dioxygenase [Rhodospirillales bacterium]
MLKEDNELLWHVGRGTPMGEFMRRFWVPATLSSEIVAGGSPQRIRLLGQNMVAFRAHDGRLGVLDEGCPHRGVSLSLARNADCALTCIFHGWKIDVTGKVLDVPPEPVERRQAFAARVKVRTYPAHEAAGIVWIWLGEGEPTPFPALNWIDLPANQVRCSVGIVRANWVFGIEGQLDSAHVGILHKDWADRPADTVGSESIANAIFDSSPKLEFEDQPYGYREAALRTMPDGQTLARVREYMMPWYSYIPSHGGRSATQLLTISVPIDDDTSAQWDVYYNLTRSIERDNFPVPAGVRDFTHLTIADGFGQDRAAVQGGKWSGYAAVRVEDFAVAMAQHMAANREHEHLSTSDRSIVYARRMLRDAVRKHADGEALDCFKGGIDWSLIRSFAEFLPKEADWKSLPRG